MCLCVPMSLHPGRVLCSNHKCHLVPGGTSNAASTFNVVVSGSHDLFIKLWDVENDYKNVATFRGHEHSISTCRFLPGDTRVVSASRDRTIRIWEVATTYVTPSISAECYLTCIYACSHCVKVIRPHEDWVRTALPSPDGRYLATSCMDHVSFSWTSD